MDKTDRKLYIAIGACAALGAVTGIFLAAGLGPFGIAGAAVAGAALGGVGLPVAGIGAFFLGKTLLHFARNDGMKMAVILGMVAVGCARAVFVTPLKKLADLCSRKEKEASSAPPAQPPVPPSALPGKPLQDGFNAKGGNAAPPPSSPRINPPSPPAP